VPECGRVDERDEPAKTGLTDSPIRGWDAVAHVSSDRSDGSVAPDRGRRASPEDSTDSSALRTDVDDEDRTPTDDAPAPAPSEAFGALAGETRTAVVRALADVADPLAFSGLFERTDEETTAGFAYHLRQLTGQFVRKRATARPAAVSS